MITKQISSNNLISADRYVEVETVLKTDEIILICNIYFKKNGLRVFPEMNKTKIFSTKQNMVDAQGNAVEKIYPETVEGQQQGQPYYPEGAIPEIVFFKNLPASAFPQPNIWDKIEALVDMRITSLDAKGYFN